MFVIFSLSSLYPQLLSILPATFFCQKVTTVLLLFLVTNHLDVKKYGSHLFLKRCYNLGREHVTIRSSRSRDKPVWHSVLSANRYSPLSTNYLQAFTSIQWGWFYPHEARDSQIVTGGHIWAGLVCEIISSYFHLQDGDEKRKKGWGVVDMIQKRIHWKKKRGECGF